MAERPKNATAVGRTRRIAGYVFIVLGVAISTRAGWLGFFYVSAFGQAEWIRFWFWLWTGVFSALVGCWLVSRSRVVAWVTVVWIVVPFTAVFVYESWLR
jgi:hypothetical protein